MACCSACQSGRIPCPEPDVVRAKKVKINNSYTASSASLQARALDNGASESRTTRPFKIPETKTINNVSIEEWDCPRPGKRKYLPKEVKENIRKNLKKVKSEKTKETKANMDDQSSEQ
ncbi:MAG: hypothetical protein JNM57_15520 [Cyclobacteriaceae bacterium]|nr:hypothetical protein [Cyclobacteriaceae bacterium]